MRYALVDESGAVVNVVAWDGQSDWQPPKGMQVIRDKTGEADVGGSFDGERFLPAPEAEAQTPQPSVRDLIVALEERIAKLEQFQTEKTLAFDSEG